jgi:hypothetical protein
MKAANCDIDKSHYLLFCTRPVGTDLLIQLEQIETETLRYITSLYYQDLLS